MPSDEYRPRDSNPEPPRSERGASCHWARTAWRPRALAGVRSPGLEPGSTWPSTRPVYQIAARAHEPSSGADPDHLPYGGKVTAVCDGAVVAAAQWYGRRDSNPHELALARVWAWCGCQLRHARVRRQGIEPRIPGLRVRCFNRYSSRRRRGPPGDRTLLSSLEGWHITTMLAGRYLAWLQRRY